VRTGLAVFRAMFVMIFTAHLLACFFYMMMDKQAEKSWMNRYDPELMDPEISGPEHRFATAFYWAVTTISTIGYGDVVPKTHNERIYALIAQLIGAIVFAFALGNMTQVFVRICSLTIVFSNTFSRSAT
jgi:hypothetical protein